MKKTCIAILLGCGLVGSAFASNPGDVVFTNNNLQHGIDDAVQFKLVMQDQREAYTNELSAASGANVTTLSSGAIGSQTSSFDVYIQNIKTGSGYVKCLSGVSYNPTWAAQNVFGFDNGTDVRCDLGGQRK